ncbi:MAG: VOC family protein [Actinomycetota bacterium]|nr:VOC family protein [Actinomycetota bacterium]
MSERDSYNPGEFCWVDLATPDVGAAAHFYGDLIGWTHEPASGGTEDTAGYGFFLFNGKVVAGVGPLQSEQQPTAWMSYIDVADAEESAGKVRDAGGTVLMGPFELPSGAGRMAVCHDPEGAFFAIYEPGHRHGSELVNEIGTWTWNQLATRDLDAAKKFYGTVFGWVAEISPEAPEDSPYLMWQVEGQKWEEGLAGVMTIGDELSADMPAETPAHWMVYFAVADADEAIAKVKSGGGNVLFGPQAIPVGKLAVFTDPAGAAFAIIEPDYPEAR